MKKNGRNGYAALHAVTGSDSERATIFPAWSFSFVCFSIYFGFYLFHSVMCYGRNYFVVAAAAAAAYVRWNERKLMLNYYYITLQPADDILYIILYMHTLPYLLAAAADISLSLSLRESIYYALPCLAFYL